MANAKLSGSVAVPTQPLTVDRLLSAPLPELLAEVGAEVIDAPAEYDHFEGVAVQPYAGPIQVVLPVARDERYRDAMVRRLVGQIVGADLLPLPGSMQSRTFGGTR